jgi:hypothetical protein
VVTEGGSSDVELEGGELCELPISQGGGQRRRTGDGREGHRVGWWERTSRPVACRQRENRKVEQRSGWAGKKSEALFGATLREVVEVGNER